MWYTILMENTAQPTHFFFFELRRALVLFALGEQPQDLDEEGLNFYQGFSMGAVYALIAARDVL